MSLKWTVFTMHICLCEVTRFKETEGKSSEIRELLNRQESSGYLPWWPSLVEQSLGSSLRVQDQVQRWYASSLTRKVELQDHKTSAVSEKDMLVDRNKMQWQWKVTLRLLPYQIFNSSLGDYTQWVHLACPHWFRSTLSMVCPAWVKKKREDSKTLADC